MKYYKHRNGNEALEYDISIRLKQIEKLLSERNENFICGVLSAILSNYLTGIIGNLINCENGSVVFIIFLFVLYLVFKYCFNIVRKGYKVYQAIKSRHYIPEEYEEELIDCFYCKITNEIILAVSLINRVEKLKNSGMKQELWDIYIFQAKHSIEKATRFLQENISDFTEKQIQEYKQLIGESALMWLIKTALSYLEKIHNYNENIDIRNTKIYFNNLKEKLGL